MDDDTELDTEKPTGTSPLNSTTESYDLCGTSATITSTISATLISELGNQKLVKGCLERYADEVGDTYYASDKLTSDKLSSVSTLEAKTLRLRENIISKTLDNIKRSMQDRPMLCIGQYLFHGTSSRIHEKMPSRSSVSINASVNSCAMLCTYYKSYWLCQIIFIIRERIFFTKFIAKFSHLFTKHFLIHITLHEKFILLKYFNNLFTV